MAEKSRGWIILPVAAVILSVAAPAQQPPAPSNGDSLKSVANDSTIPEQVQPSPRARASFSNPFANYKAPTAPALPMMTADRAQSLIRDGKLYLSLYEALALAIENNLDVEVERYNLSLANSDVLRTKGGGYVRGIDYSIAESPTGVGGPGSPLLNAAATTVTPTTPTVNDLTSLNVLTQSQQNLSVQGTSPYSNGPPLPLFDPSILGQAGWFQRSNTTVLTSGAGGSLLPSVPQPLDYTVTNLAYVEGFSPGTQLEVDLNNASPVLFGSKSQANPFSTPNTSVTVTQPLLRGFGRDVNLRYLKIANLNQKISRLLFDQQLISTVYGISRLYYDLVSLRENEQVKRETLAAANKLFDDDKSQVQQGTLAPLELTRAQALVSSSQLDLIQAEGLVHQQEVILKTELARRGSADPVLANVRIIPTDPIQIPSTDGLKPVDQLVSEAVAERPDLMQAAMQVETGEIALKGSQNATRPELDLVGNFQTRGNAETSYFVPGSPGTGLIASVPDLGAAGLRTSRVYQAGIQLNLPLRNRAAQADAARDLIQLRQSQARNQRLMNQAREEVENAVIALESARSALSAAIQSRQYQEQLLSAEKDKLSVGASTNLLVIQQQAYLSQARSTEVTARSVWIKARVALDRALGSILEKNNIRFDNAVAGHLPASPAQP